MTAIKLMCGHKVETTVTPDGEAAWCPICQRDLFTGWPEHMTRNADTAARLKTAASKYLDECIETGVEPRLSAIVGACESVIRGCGF